MTDCQIRFKYLDEEVIIQCQRNDLMKDIINRYLQKSGLSKEGLSFFYCKKINIDLKLAEINDKNEEILIVVCLKEKESEIKKLDSKEYIHENNIDSEIEVKVKIGESDVIQDIYFLDKTVEYAPFRDRYDDFNEKINHGFLEELNENNTILIIDGQKLRFKKSFTPPKIGIYSIKLLFKIKLSSCAYMFYGYSNIINIDFSKFNTENVTICNECSITVPDWKH